LIEKEPEEEDELETHNKGKTQKKYNKKITCKTMKMMKEPDQNLKLRTGVKLL
jgi:hypothetical protein